LNPNWSRRFLNVKYFCSDNDAIINQILIFLITRNLSRQNPFFPYLNERMKKITTAGFLTSFQTKWFY
jgi:hypothetical protein